MTIEYAHQYAGRGLAVFPVSRSKKPFKGSHGLRDATTDPAKVEALWAGRRGANVAVALDHMLVLDADGAKGLQTLQQLAADVGYLPRTLTIRTPRGGLHLWYRTAEQIGSRAERRARSGDDGFDWRGKGGYVLLPPSTTPAGAYTWLERHPVADAPPALIEWLKQNGGGIQKITASVSDSFAHLGPKPAFLNGAGSSLAERAQDAISQVPWTAHEEARLRAALAVLPADGYDDWYRNGMALHHLRWVRSDGTDAGFDIWVDWGATCPDKFSLAASEEKWLSFGRNTENRRIRTVASIYSQALEAGWNGNVAPLPKAEINNNVNGVHALPVALTQVKSDSIVFPDTNKVGNPTATCRNARAAIRGLGIECRHDLFHGKMLVGGHAIDQWAGEISDDALQMLRVAIERQYRFDPGLVNVHDAAVQECLQHGFDPIVGYLDALQWDGRTRLATWLADYLGADATPLNQEIGTLALAAAVRRARRPGYKFDPIIVLEGREGTSKSAAICTLAGEENFSDQTILGANDREIQELVQGVWLYEIADLSGISRADTERVKAFASRQIDRARPAYGRTRVDRARRCVFFATTNDATYLRSQTGNRRFWPVATTRIKLAALQRDRDQLWAEASEYERHNASVTLPERLWGAAAELQEARREYDPWDDRLANFVPGMKDDEEALRNGILRVSTRDLFDVVLQIPPDRQTDMQSKRLAHVMRRQGWDGPRVYRKGELTVRGYIRPVTGATGVTAKP